jgi:tetratricopeptide (TPR) repeat protein
MSGQAMDQLQELQIVFEMATYLNLLEYYEDADLYYHYILKDFQSRDIYNNAGVTALLAALPYFTKKEMPYGLPIELDPTSRLGKNNTRNSDLDRQQEREKRIHKALEYFDRALLLDRQYAPAFLNKAAAFVLLEDWEEANYWIRKASKEDLNDKMSTDLLVLKGIIAAQQDDPDGAKEWWEKGKAQHSDLAVVNLNILENGPLAATQTKVYGFAERKEKIEALEIESYLVDTAPDQMIEIDDRKACGFHQRPNSSIYSHLVDGGNEYVIVQVVNEMYSGTSMEGVAMGDSYEQLLEKYGEPERQIQTPDGALFIYPARNMIFQLEERTGVKGWGTYRIKEK